VLLLVQLELVLAALQAFRQLTIQVSAARAVFHQTVVRVAAWQHRLRTISSEARRLIQMCP
jgi:membrane-anchored glycerophosphoryl diester phosphodiesterase (GDPDase)